ncbi:Uncharacterized conserved protein, DUF934 family [Polynucleobacter meluiroseus]|uniref:Uncharacterized conserved protein, DUF934 family n=1 Tax=Polynucleobacter meluiroseus TaxID=1938814 RepID=A0A240E109_9BURK|nr:DUF934 domain-containing protein [Polynucleobacter meluiroseus]SNX29125.1 Uncharacterized conserved protein, DUF934 family [Polynucleobacter meluiroseus]
MNPHMIHFPKDGKPTIAPNEWQVWNGEIDEGGLPDLEHGTHQVLVPFSWWITHQHNDDVVGRVKQGKVGVWFAADEDILKHSELIQEGRELWPVVGAHFPIFRDGRSFSTAALLRERFAWAGEIRAIGDVLVDQLLQGARCGFDAFELRPDQNLEIALKQFDLFDVTTQNSWRGKRTLLEA